MEDNYFFPLHCNEEQQSANKKLKFNKELLILGGHGTGKTSTIINLACNLASHGENVLIAGESEKVLYSLQSKIPSDLRNVCSSFYVSGGLKILKCRRPIFGEMELYNEILSLKNDLKACRKRKKEKSDNIAKYLNYKSQKIVYVGKTYTIGYIENWLKENIEYDYFEDDITQETSIPLNKGELDRLKLYLNRAMYLDLNFIISNRALFDELPNRKIYDERLYFIKNDNNKYEASLSYLKGWNIDYNANIDFSIVKENITSCIKDLSVIKNGILKDTYRLLLKSEVDKSSLMLLEQKLSYYLDSIRLKKLEIGVHIVKVPIEGRGLLKLRDDFLVVYNHILKKKVLSDTYKLLHSKYDYVFEGCKADLMPLNTMKQAKYIKPYIELLILKENFLNEWEKYKNYYYLPNINLEREDFDKLLQDIHKEINILLNLQEKFNRKVMKFLKKCTYIGEVNYLDEETYRNVAKLILNLQFIQKYDKVRSQVKITEDILNYMGINNWNKLYEYEEILGQAKDFTYLLYKLRKTCPKFTTKLLNGREDIESFYNRFKWSQWLCILKNYKKVNIPELKEQLKIEEQTEIDISKEIIAKQIKYDNYFREGTIPNKAITIMTLSKLYDIQKKGYTNIFDVIIYEDAERIESKAFNTFNIAKQIVVCGNSNEAFGDSLLDRAYAVIPERVEFTKQYRNSSEMVRLKDNKYCFRHMNANEKCYPPSIVSYKVVGGTRDEKECINLKEASAIVKTIVSLCKEEDYMDMSIGVISLLGYQQARVIERMLIDRLGKSEMRRRSFLAGDSFSFQGEERDLIFLSMVAADNMRYASLTKDSDALRFSIALSRAKNQTFVFYSLDYHKISNKCSRYALLKYCDEINIKNNIDGKKSISVVV